MDVVAGRIHTEGVTVLQMTPSRLLAYLEQNSILTLSGVRILLVGGEALAPTLLTELRRLQATTTVFHVYGPTETTIWSSADLIRGDNISLGLPLPGEEIFVVSKDGALMPRGLPGEICIAGDGVGRGYLNQPALTAGQFVSFPFLPGRRAYKTGDVGQVTIGGHLRYLGRSDAQVKIQGVRVETAEVENQLLLCIDVKEAVVLAQSKAAAGKTLWAYVVSGAKETELRRHLIERMPYYMVPEVFVFLDAMPLTANGKVDRQALQARTVGARCADAVARPESATEGKLIEIWVALLRGRRSIGADESFFALGGNSLKAVQMIARIEAEFRVVLSLQDIFASPTIAELARLVEAAAWAAAPRAESRPGENDEFIV
jgi:acyl-coenzyme A synthetase/AMP-(fatty) acid ligase/acyl carrier protein